MHKVVVVILNIEISKIVISNHRNEQNAMPLFVLYLCTQGIWNKLRVIAYDIKTTELNQPGYSDVS